MRKSVVNEEIINWAAERKMSEVRIDIDIIGFIEIPIKMIAKKLMNIRSYAKKYKIDVFGFWSRPAENLNESILQSQVAFCGAIRGNSICVNPAGKIYPCGYSTSQIGSLNQLNSFLSVEGNYYKFVRDHTIGEVIMCKNCSIEGQCGGGCNITKEYALYKNSSKIERMCEFYRLMTRELLLEQIREHLSRKSNRKEVTIHEDSKKADQIEAETVTQEKSVEYLQGSQ